MSLNVKPGITPKEKEANISTITQTLTGVRDSPLPQVSENYISLEFSELKNAAGSASDDIGSGVNETGANTTKAGMAAALYRDMLYAHASRGHMLALGANNAIRENYEGMIIGMDAGL